MLYSSYETHVLYVLNGLHVITHGLMLLTYEGEYYIITSEQLPCQTWQSTRCNSLKLKRRLTAMAGPDRASTESEVALGRGIFARRPLSSAPQPSARQRLCQGVR